MYHDVGRDLRPFYSPMLKAVNWNGQLNLQLMYVQSLAIALIPGHGSDTSALVALCKPGGFNTSTIG
jgi:hypothetical protein